MAKPKAEAKEVVEMWNSRDKFQMDETNMRIVLFAPLLYEGNTRDPKWQQWMRKLDLIIDDKTLLKRKKEVFFILDTFDIVVEYVHTEFSTITTDDYDQIACLSEKMEKVDELEVAMKEAKKDSFFVIYYDNLKTETKIKDSQVTRLMALFVIEQYWHFRRTVIHEEDMLAPMKLRGKDEKDMNTLKDEGNNLFRGQKFRKAREMYTKALAKDKYNHILYGNRCQASLHMKYWWDALWDARRAVTIKPDWQKGHYRYAQAFFELKYIERALHENKRGQKLCNDAGSQTGDLQRQATKFNDEKKRLVSLNSKKNEKCLTKERNAIEKCLADGSLALVSGQSRQAITQDDRAAKPLKATSKENPPSADATCRYAECTAKRQMYFSDLDFKGYIKVQCSERCYIDYHIDCWKAIKNKSNFLRDKEALKTKCSTPDCLGTLSCIKVIKGNGIIKTEFKVENPPKPAKDRAKKRSAPKPTKDQKEGKKFQKYQQSESYKAEKGQGDAEGQPGHGQTAEGAHADKEDASSKSATGATRTGLDAGIAAATDSTQNDASRSQMVEGAEGDAEIKPEATYKLKRKRDEFDDVEQKKTNRAQPKKSRNPVGLHEEASNIVQFDIGPTTRHLYGADDAEEQKRMNRGWQSTPTLLEDHPFAFPEHLQDAAREMDASFKKEAFIMDEEKSQKMALFLYLENIFSTNGPLHLQDPIITRYMEQLTCEHQELILKRGGLKPFLLESEDMVIIGDYASIKSDAQKCRELAICNGYQEREPRGDVANLDSVPFIPRAVNSGPSVFRVGPAGDNYHSTLSDDAKRGLVSGLDSFDGDDDSDEEDGEEDNEMKTGEIEGTKNEAEEMKLRSETALLREQRLTADARRAQLKRVLEESKNVPQELKEAVHALELSLKAMEEEAVKSLGRACKAESQLLHLFMAKTLKPLEDACKEATYHIKTIAYNLQNNPMIEEYVRAISMWQDCLATNQQAASKAQNDFQKQVNAIQNGATLDSMKPVEVPAPYKPEGLVKDGGLGTSGSPIPQPALTLPSSTTHETVMASPGLQMPGARRQGKPKYNIQIFDPSTGRDVTMSILRSMQTEEVRQNGGAVENQPASQPLTNTKAQRKVMAMAQAEAMAEAEAQAQAQAQVMAQAQAQAQSQPQAQAQAQAQLIQQTQAMSLSQTPPVGSQGEVAIQQAAMSGNGFNHYQQSNAIPPNMQHTLQQMQIWQQQGAVPRHQHQLQQQQILARQQYMEQQVARPKNSFERIMLRLHGFFPNYNKVQLTGFLKEVRTSNNGSLSGLSVEEIIRRVKDLVRQRQRETAGNASQRMQNKGFSNHQGMSGGRPTAPPATFNAQPKRSSYHNAPTPPQPAWSTVGHIQGLNWHKELVDGEAEEEDPCVICHDEMSGDNTLEIECGHIFHIHCLHEWLKQQQTCPTCRNFTILKDDYPSLHK